jgi:hypothetical protein
MRFTDFCGVRLKSRDNRKFFLWWSLCYSGFNCSGRLRKLYIAISIKIFILFICRSVYAQTTGVGKFVLHRSL